MLEEEDLDKIEEMINRRNNDGFGCGVVLFFVLMFLCLGGC